MGHSLQNTTANRHPDLDTPWRSGIVVATLGQHSAKLVSNGQEETLAVATHLPMLVPGQQVLVAQPDAGPCLIVAAFPLADNTTPATANQEVPILQFDAATGTLSIQAAQLKLQGIGAVELHCGDAVLRLNAQGEIFSHAQAITQSAIGAHRIEGASVDIN